MATKQKKTSAHAHDRHGDDCNLGTNETNVRAVMEQAATPLSAYDIIPLLSTRLGHPVAPPTVYRALKHLTAHGLVTRIESRNAYVLCQNPGETHDCLFFICRTCGTATEAPDHKVGTLLRREAAALGFDVSRQILEIVGLCQTCTAAQP